MYIIKKLKIVDKSERKNTLMLILFIYFQAFILIWQQISKCTNEKCTTNIAYADTCISLFIH